MKFAHLMVACAALSVPMGAFAGQSEPVPAQPATIPAPSGAKSDRVICRTDDTTGSRITKKKICMTAAQWRESSYQAGQSVERRSPQ
jgi:hypothetical protein